jgi:flagellar protein FliT
MHTTPVPPTRTPVLAIYQQILSITGAMHLAAQAQNWDHLIELGQAYCSTVDTLRSVPAAQLSNSQESEDRAQLLRQILSNDAAVRNLALPEIARLGQMLMQFGKQKSMLRAYGSPGGMLQ